LNKFYCKSCCIFPNILPLFIP